MGFWSNRISREELQPGDHIYAYRKLGAYSHHGIYVGEGWVIHLTATQAPISSTSSGSSKGPVSVCINCGHDPNTKRGVVRTCIDCFLQGHGLLRFQYNVSSRIHFHFKNPGTCSTDICYPRPQTIRLATEIYKKDQLHGKGFREYSVYNNNCETFARYCKTGKRVSLQIKFKTSAHQRWFLLSGLRHDS